MKLSEYYDLLETHDWYHPMSDSSKVEEAGRKAEKQLKELANKKGLSFVQLFEDYHAFMWNEKSKPIRPTD